MEMIAFMCGFGTAGRPGSSGAALLLVQASKVISAHASSVGDPLLGVPLHCAAGMHAEAVSILQVWGIIGVP